MIDLQPFQRRFLKRALSPGVKTACMSYARGSGKSALAAHILTRCMTPGDAMFEAGAEYVLGAASTEQARNPFRFIRAELEPTGEYRFIDSLTRLGITHKPTNTKIRVQSGNSKTAFGLVGVPVCVLDEPGAFDQTAGDLMYAALRTAQGKPGSPLRLIIIGTLAPHGVPGNWWYELVQRGTRGSVYVQSVSGRSDRWDSWREIMRANPLAAVDADTRATLREERAEAKSDSRLKAQFMSYRLNSPSRDESETLLTVDDFKLAMARPVGLQVGRPIVGVDLGAGRAWSAAVAVWESGRVDALACAPGIPDLGAQERRDRVSSGTYRRLHERGVLSVAEGVCAFNPLASFGKRYKRGGEFPFAL